MNNLKGSLGKYLSQLTEKNLKFREYKEQDVGKLLSCHPKDLFLKMF